MSVNYFVCFWVLLVVYGASAKLNAQEIMLDMDSQKSVISKRGGLNHRSFGYLDFDYQVYAFHQTADMKVIDFKSRNFSIGYTRLFRLSDRWLIGGRGSFFNDGFFISQKAGKVFPTPQTHQSEKVLTYNASLEFSSRVILKKEHERPGLYFDLGIYGNGLLGSRYFMSDSSTDPALLGKNQELKVRGLKYVEPVTGGMIVRLGLNRFAFVFRHRLTNWVKPSYGFPQPPKNSMGLEFSLY